MTPTPAHLLVVVGPLAAGYVALACWGVRRDDLRRRLRALSRVKVALDCSGLVFRRFGKATRQAAAAFALFGEAIAGGAVGVALWREGRGMHPSASPTGHVRISRWGPAGHVHFPAPPLGAGLREWPLGDAQRVAALADEELAAWARFIADTKEGS